MPAPPSINTPGPKRIVKFISDAGPLFIDLESVEMVTWCAELFPGKVMFQFKSGLTTTVNQSFKQSVEQLMDAWMNWVNAVSIHHDK